MTFYILVAIIHSCAQEETPIPDNNGNIPVTFNLRLPADMPIQQPEIRSMSVETENTISSIDLLSFVSNGSQYNYLYHVPVNYNQGSNSFTVRLRVTPGARQIFVVMANASQTFADAQITDQDNLETALSKLIVVSQEEWPAAINGSSATRELPMYFQTGPLTITESTSQLGTYDLIRMLARIDVSVASPASNNFVLTEVMIYNRKSCGYIAYNSSYNPVTKTVSSANVPPFFPGTSDDPTIKEPSVVYRVPTTGPDAGSLIRSLYTFEAHGGQNKNNLTSIIIGGNYSPTPTPSGAISYYRVDINTPSTPPANVAEDILRNHLYDISIQNVNGPGAPTPDAAFNGPSQITAKVVDWNLAQNNVVLDQQYRLILSEDQVFLDYRGLGPSRSPITFTATTDHPSGVSAIENIIDISTGLPPTWLTLNRITPAGQQSCQILISAQLNNNQTDRKARFTIRTGNLRYVVMVTQAKIGYDMSTMPNSYIITRGSSIDIPVFKAYAIWSDILGQSIPEGGTLTAELAWEDSPSVISGIQMITNAEPEQSGIRVQSFGPAGNALIVFKVDGIIRWSWHLWVTNYNPNITSGQVINTTRTPSLTFMDRNLGAEFNSATGWGSASGNSGTDAVKYGLFYQWGRKDPFPGGRWSGSSSSSTEPNLYDLFNTPSTSRIQKNAVTGLNYSINNPTVFLMTGANDWYGVGNNGKLWDDGGKKAIFDPCPQGWRVPSYGTENLAPWYNLTNDNKGTFNRGFTWDGSLPGQPVMGYVPATGFRNNSSGNLGNVSSYGYMWAANALTTGSNNEAYYVSFSSSAAVTSVSTLRTNGFQVRCVKE